VRSKTACLAVAAVSLALLSVSGCSSSSGELSTGCNDSDTATIRVTVVDFSNESENICGATVTVSLGNMTVTLKAAGGAGTCSYVGNVTESGTYDIVVMASGYPITKSTTTVQTGCSVSPEVDVTMN
jgi:hypothetical protein